MNVKFEPRFKEEWWLKSNFKSQRQFYKHYKKHREEFGNISEEEYLSIARNLLSAKLNENIKGFV